MAAGVKTSLAEIQALVAAPPDSEKTAPAR